jgi:hypothetical protein
MRAIILHKKRLNFLKRRMLSTGKSKSLYTGVENGGAAGER